MWVAFN